MLKVSRRGRWERRVYNKFGDTQKKTKTSTKFHANRGVDTYIGSRAYAYAGQQWVNRLGEWKIAKSNSVARARKIDGSYFRIHDRPERAQETPKVSLCQKYVAHVRDTGAVECALSLSYLHIGNFGIADCRSLLEFIFIFCAGSERSRVWGCSSARIQTRLICEFGLLAPCGVVRYEKTGVKYSILLRFIFAFSAL